MTSRTKTRIAIAASYAVFGAAVEVPFLVPTPSWLRYTAIGILASPLATLVVVFVGAMVLGAFDGIHRRNAHIAIHSPTDQDDVEVDDGEGGGV